MYSRMLWLASISLLFSAPAAAGGWKTVVSDRDGMRSIGLIGSVGDDESQGIAIPCAESGGAYPPMVYAITTPSKAYRAGPGTAATLMIDRLELAGTLYANDSSKTAGWFEAGSLPDVIAAIRGTVDGTSIRLRFDDYEEQFSIPSKGIEAAITEFDAACPLHLRQPH